MIFLVLIAFCLPYSLATTQIRFDGDEVLRVYAKTPEQLQYLQDMRSKLDFWTGISKTRATDIRIPSADKLKIHEKLQHLGIKFEIFIDDVQKYIFWEEKSQVRSAPSAGMDWTSYHSLEEIHAFMDKIAEENKDIAEVLSIGKSTEGRDLKLIRIGKKSENGIKKKSYFIDGGIHAREWISPAVTSWMINELLTKRADHIDLLNSIDFYIIPSLNPDGYEFSRTTDRMWRKTRSKALQSQRCIGTDPNRNYDDHFGGEGTSRDPCSEIFAGKSAFSEPETAAVRDFILSRSDADWLVYTAIHSYSQLILTPYGWGNVLPKDYRELRRVADKAAAALKATHGTDFEVGSVTELLYAAAGGSDDWAYEHGFEYAYTMEVRDTGRYGFMLPASQIVPCAQESFNAVLVMAKEALLRK